MRRNYANEVAEFVFLAAFVLPADRKCTGSYQFPGLGVQMATVHHCLDIFACPLEALSLDEAGRRKVADGITRSSAPGGFAPNALAHSSPISASEEALVIGVLLVVMGGPLLILPMFLYCIFYCSWTSCLAWIVTLIFLSRHPLPRCEAALARTRFTLALYKYFSSGLCEIRTGLPCTQQCPHHCVPHRINQSMARPPAAPSPIRSPPSLPYRACPLVRTPSLASVW